MKWKILTIAALTAAWFVAFLIPEYSRSELCGAESSWPMRLAFVAVVSVGLFAMQELLRLRNNRYAIALLGIGAPVIGFCFYEVAWVWINDDAETGTQRICNIMDVIRYDFPKFIGNCWYVSLVVGLGSALVLSRNVVDRPDA